MWRKEGLSEEPDAIREANTEYRMDMDSVGTFIVECLMINLSEDCRLPTKFFMMPILNCAAATTKEL